MIEDIIVAPIAIIVTFGVPAFVIWKYFNQRHQERMLIIEKGEPDIYNKLLKHGSPSVNPLNALKWGLLIVFCGGGLWLGTWMHQMQWYSKTIEPACMLMGGGIGLVIYYLIALKMEKKEQSPTEHKE